MWAGELSAPLMPGRALVYVDGYLISNFLGRFDAPRWNMVNDEALYGHFSAICPGNSMGATVIKTERKPKGFEASVSVKCQDQPFKEYGSTGHFGGMLVSTRLASRAESGLWWVMGHQLEDSVGQPMTFVRASETPDPPPPGVRTQFTGPTGTRVSGILYDT